MRRDSVWRDVQGPVCTENLDPGVVMMKSAEYRVRTGDSGALNRARDRRILALQATGTAEGNSRWPLRQLSRSCYLINSDMVFLHYDRPVSVSRTARMRGGALRPL